jgi:hypothetical protein
MTFIEIITEVKSRLNNLIGSSITFDDTDIKASINNGYDELADVTEFNELNKVITTSGDLYDDLYDPAIIGPGFLTLRHVFNSLNNLWLEPWDYRKLDQSFSRWETLFSLSWKFILRGLSYFSGYPRQVAGSQYTVYYTAMPTALVNNTDVPAFPVEFHLGLVNYATFELLAQKQEVTKAMSQWATYLEYQDRLMKYVRGRQGLDGSPTFGMPASSRSAYEPRPWG